MNANTLIVHNIWTSHVHHLSSTLSIVNTRNKQHTAAFKQWAKLDLWGFKQQTVLFTYMCQFPDWLPTVIWWWTFSQNPQLFREKLSIPHWFIFFSSSSSSYLYDFHSLVIVKEFWPTFLCIIESGLWGLWAFAMHSSLNKITNVLLSVPIRLRSGL